MSLPKELNHKFNELKILLTSRDKQSFKMEAHGGYSILFVYPPHEEQAYLRRIRQEYSDAAVIDIAAHFVKYIQENGEKDFWEVYAEYSSDPGKMFKSEYSDNDLFRRILQEIQTAGEANKLPILIRTGALYGTGIDNISIMESKVVYELPLPLSV